MPYDIIVGRDDADKKRFGDKGLIYLGKGFVKMGNYTSLSNRILMDAARSHVVLVAGKRGSGKSYSLSTIAEELSILKGDEKDSIASIMFDTMGIFWTMKFKNEKEKELLAEWGLKPDKVPVRVFAPFGKFKEYEEKGIPVDEPFAINPSDVGIEDWLITFNLSLVDPVSILIQNIFADLMKKRNYDIDEVIKAISAEHGASTETKNAAVSLFRAADSWGIFSKKGSDIKDLVKPGMTTVIDISVYNAVGVFNVRALVVGLLSRMLFKERMEERKKEELEAIRRGAAYLSFKQQREIPIVWVFIDEVHEFLGKEDNAAKASLIQLLREGRQPGISVVMATQQPGALIRDVITQTDILISHKVTALRDIGALNEMMQSYIVESIKKHMDDLPRLKGSAIVLDDNSERIYPIRVRPKFTWHGGESPVAIKAGNKS